MGTGDLKFYQSQGLNTFWGPFFYFFLLNPSFICHGSKFASLFIILQEHMSLWLQCNLFLGHHQVHDALLMTSQWRHYDVTREGHNMSFQSLNQGWTYMSFHSSKGWPWWYGPFSFLLLNIKFIKLIFQWAIFSKFNIAISVVNDNGPVCCSMCRRPMTPHFDSNHCALVFMMFQLSMKVPRVMSMGGMMIC